MVWSAGPHLELFEQSVSKYLKRQHALSLPTPLHRGSGVCRPSNSSSEYCPFKKLRVNMAVFSSPRSSAGLRTMGSWPLVPGGLWLRGGSSASGPASVARDPSAPREWAPSWTGVAAARAAPGRSESRATRGTSVTPTRACTATSQRTSRDMRLECVHVSGSVFPWNPHLRNRMLLTFSLNLQSSVSVMHTVSVWTVITKRNATCCVCWHRNWW